MEATTNSTLGLAGVILAAGRSSRFGSDKRIAAFGRDTLLTRSISLVENVCTHLVVVTRPADRDGGAELLGRWWNHPEIEQFCAAEAEQGMGRSLANGISRLRELEAERSGRFSGVLLMLADMPYIAPTTIEKVVAAGSVDKIVLPCYQYRGEKRYGHPVFFGRLWFDDLEALQGDRGGKTVIMENSSARIELDVDDPGILRDVDRPGDLMDRSNRYGLLKRT